MPPSDWQMAPKDKGGSSGCPTAAQCAERITSPWKASSLRPCCNVAPLAHCAKCIGSSSAVTPGSCTLSCLCEEEDKDKADVEVVPPTPLRIMIRRGRERGRRGCLHSWERYSMEVAANELDDEEGQQGDKDDVEQEEEG